MKNMYIEGNGLYTSDLNGLKGKKYFFFKLTKKYLMFL